MTRHAFGLRSLTVAVGAALTLGCGGGATLPVGDASRALAIVVHDTGTTLDHRLFGTNLAAWLGPERLADPEFQQLTVESGTTLLRMPGGSWSNSYDWLACENGDEDGCFWTWAARPSDFIDFLEATEIEGMWTVSINETAQAAAAAVAFFNGSTDDDTVIGMDRDGVDWGTVQRWAQLRAEGGNPEPIGIDLWEVGNEVYGGRPEMGGAECASFGWEDVWTCDGSEYVTGTDDHDGFTDIRAAMLAVDPTIEVGAVGVDDPGSWNDWGQEVIDATGDELDFYVVHDYAFDKSPTPRAALNAPQRRWVQMIPDLRAALPESAAIAVTEYNLISFADGDTERTMTQATNALFIADTIGQMAGQGIEIANQWNLANGDTSPGTDYGMIDLSDDGGPDVYPQYTAMAAWSRAGTTLLDVDMDHDDLGIYPTRHDDGRLTIVMVNRSGLEMKPTITIDAPHGRAAELTTAAAGDPTDDEMTTTISSVEVGTTISPALAPWSISVLDIAPAGSGADAAQDDG